MGKIAIVLLLAAFLLPENVDSAAVVQSDPVIEVIDDEVADPVAVVECGCDCKSARRPIRSFLKNRIVLRAVGKFMGAKR